VTGVLDETYHVFAVSANGSLYELICLEYPECDREESRPRSSESQRDCFGAGLAGVSVAELMAAAADPWGFLRPL